MASIAREIVLITGANSGIGLELARQFLTHGPYHIYLTARDPQKGLAALRSLQSLPNPSPDLSAIAFLPLDLQSDDQIASAVTSIRLAHGKLDILINNAGVALPAGTTERERFANAFDINATGPYLLAKAMAPLLRRATNPRIINISSGAGSIGRRLFPESPMYKITGAEYRASKVAGNMLAACLYVDLGLGVEQIDGLDKRKEVEEERKGENEKKLMKVFTFDPGFTASNLSSHNRVENGARTAEATVKNIMELVDGMRDGEAGRFLHNTGEYPW